MDPPVLALVAFAVGTAGNAVRFVPQFVRTAVRGRVAGLSRTAVWLAFTANVLWLCFGLAISDRLFIALGVLQTALVTATLTRYVLVAGWARNARHAAVAVLASAGFVALALTGSGLALETLGAALGVVVGAPQLLHLWRRRRTAVDVSGVAPAEYVIVVVAQVGWTVYWLSQGHPVAAAGAAWGGLARALTLLLLRSQVRRGRRPRCPGASSHRRAPGLPCSHES